MKIFQKCVLLLGKLKSAKEPSELYKLSIFFSGYNSSYTFPNLPNLAAQAAAAQAQANQTGVTAVSVSGNGGASSVTPGSCNPDWPEYSGVDR